MKTTIRLLKCFCFLIGCSFVALGLISLGTSYRIGKIAEADSLVKVERLKAIQSMYEAIPWELKIEAKNTLLQAACKKQKTKICREIQDSFNSGQRVAAK